MKISAIVVVAATIIVITIIITIIFITIIFITIFIAIIVIAIIVIAIIVIAIIVIAIIVIAIFITTIFITTIVITIVVITIIVIVAAIIIVIVAATIIVIVAATIIVIVAELAVGGFEVTAVRCCKHCEAPECKFDCQLSRPIGRPFDDCVFLRLYLLVGIIVLPVSGCVAIRNTDNRQISVLGIVLFRHVPWRMFGMSVLGCLLSGGTQHQQRIVGDDESVATIGSRLVLCDLLGDFLPLPFERFLVFLAMRKLELGAEFRISRNVAAGPAVFPSAAPVGFAVWDIHATPQAIVALAECTVQAMVDNGHQKTAQCRLKGFLVAYRQVLFQGAGYKLLGCGFLVYSS